MLSFSRTFLIFLCALHDKRPFCPSIIIFDHPMIVTFNYWVDIAIIAAIT
jgi:hypothetical protein